MAGFPPPNPHTRVSYSMVACRLNPSNHSNAMSAAKKVIKVGSLFALRLGAVLPEYVATGPDVVELPVCDAPPILTDGLPPVAAGVGEPPVPADVLTGRTMVIPLNCVPLNVVCDPPVGKITVIDES